MGRLAEVNDNFRHLRRHLLTGTDVERYPAPTPVTDAQLHRNISLRSRVGSHSLFLTIPLLIARSRILSANDMFIQVRLRKRSQRLINLHYLIPEIIRIEYRRRLHSRKSYELNQVILHHIPQSPRRLVKTSALLNTQILYSSNLHIINIITIP